MSRLPCLVGAFVAGFVSTIVINEIRAPAQPYVKMLDITHPLQVYNEQYMRGYHATNVTAKSIEEEWCQALKDCSPSTGFPKWNDHSLALASFGQQGMHQKLKEQQHSV
jgi:hypothetical protein